MALAPATEVTYLKGVGPQRAELLAKHGIRTIEDLLGYLPFRYEDRINFTPLREVQPGGTYTLQAVVADGGLVRYRGGGGAVYHLLVRDASGSLACKFFHGTYLEKRFRSGQRIVLHGKAELDKYRPGRLELVNPEYELIGTGDVDSTEVGRIVPIYEAIGSIGSRTLRRIIYAAQLAVAGALPDPLPAAMRARYDFPSRGDAIAFVHFPPAEVSVEALNAFRSHAHRRLIFEEFFFYQLRVALRRRREASGAQLRSDELRALPAR